MDHGIVQAQLVALLPGHVLEAVDGIGVAPAHGQMAGSVFIEQGIVEQNTAAADGAVLGDQGALAQVGGALVHGYHLLQGLFALLSAHFHSLAALEAEPELVDQLTTVGKGHLFPNTTKLNHHNQLQLYLFAFFPEKLP